ncbi:uncharacterized protein LOC129802155 [Phlebotomus papatasi]|uniref:uncharacterized protein LOC129802155 n=1 Tax=Phlebotomus papatasi TaxID=29031 RepID=UPI00248370DE|nr:uncharacterized protein LOC129802155 [Phlebotomus papatasi]XP_055703729.1 uncharacterized protein LOC129802155 [Phlebotomus papatasi]
MGCSSSQEARLVPTENGDATKVEQDDAKSEKVVLSDGDTMEDFGEDAAEAATKIQAVFRGHKVRAAMKQGDSTAVNGASEESKTEPPPSKEELEAEFDPNDKELCEAATRIQATFRGHLARKLATGAELKDDAELQEITKKVAEELDIDLSDPELNKAATKIQASFRGHKARKTDGKD